MKKNLGNQRLKKNFALKLFVSAFLFMFLFAFTSAATTLVAPVSNGNFTTSMAVNCTTAITNALNATILYNAGGTPATTLTTIVNDTPDDTMFNSTVTVSSLTDASNYNFTCLIRNDTANESSVAKNFIRIDNTAPVISVVSSSIYQSRVIDYKCSDALSASTLSISHPTGDSPTSTTLVTGSSYLTFSDTDMAGTYTLTCTDYDSNSATQEITVKALEGTTGASETGSNQGLWIIAIIIGLILWSGRK